jgi:hypothetical protein
MKRLLLATVTATLAAFAGTAIAAPPKTGGPAPTVDVMTQNQYLGADIAPLIGAIYSGNEEIINAALVNALEQIARNQTPERVRMLSAQILSRNPHLVGLQEVWKFVCLGEDFQPGTAPCDTPSIQDAFNDHLELTKAALGSSYYRVAQVDNFAVGPGAPVPALNFKIAGKTAYLQVLDRDVIFARSDIVATPYAYPCGAGKTSAQGCTYDVGFPVPGLGAVKRGFVAVDAEINGLQYRFVNTHLEVEGGGAIPGVIQTAQAGQLIKAVLFDAPTDRGLVIVGDMNSSPNDPLPSPGVPTPYMAFYGADFLDAWLIRPGNVAGLTCCQLEDLTNRVSNLSRRIDLILMREAPRKVKDVRVIGEVAADRLAPPGRGLWPSDHASVAAGLQY